MFFLRFLVIYFLLSLLSTCHLCHANTQTTKDAIDLVDYVRRSETQYLAKTSYALIEMKIERRAWSRRMIMKNWGEGRDKFLARIVEPLKERGTSTLKLDDNIWNYLLKLIGL